MRCAASALALVVLALPAGAQDKPAPEKPDCQALLTHMDALMGEYYAAGEAAIATDEPGPAIEKARKRVLKGEAQASVAMIGVGAALRGRKAPPTVAMIRQVCGFSAKNQLPLHVVSCAYFNALNPIGEREVKHRAALAEVARFEALATTGGVPEVYRARMAALKACLPER